MFEKRLTELTPHDIRQIVERQMQEDANLELKGALAARDNSRDRWYEGADTIGPEAKRSIAKELIAFANAQGGVLILGIHEDDEKRAAAIASIPRCQSLADRIAASVATTSDPKLTSMEWAGVVLDDKGGGVVVFRVPQSHRAPHRDRDTKECYIRVGDRSEPMEMRQIQDLTIQRSMGLAKTEKALDARSEAFKITVSSSTEKRVNGSTMVLHGCGVRATAVPLEVISIEGIRTDRRFHFSLPLLMTNGEGRAGEFLASRESVEWNPILRGIRSRNASSDGSYLQEQTILSDGLIECSLQAREEVMTSVTPPPKGLPHYRMMRTFAYLLIMVEAFRVRYGRPDMEFALDFEWRLPSGAQLLRDHPASFYQGLTPVDPINRVSTYGMPPRDGLSKLLASLNDDIGSSCGVGLPNYYPFDFDRAIESIVEL